MERRINNQEFITYINELLNCEALELIRCPSISQEDLFIPYMMNDAVEYYLVLENCVVTGETKGDFDEDTEAELVELAGASEREGSRQEDKREECKQLEYFAETNLRHRNMLTLRKSSGEVTTLWFDGITESIQLYQYHGIGHFWVKGQENWRQLVYTTGTIHDKQAFLGEAYVSEAERKLIPLMFFAPFRYWSPIKESLDAWYEDRPEGIQTMLELIREAGSLSKLERMIRSYQLLLAVPGPFTKLLDQKKKQMVEQIARELLKPEALPLYRLIRDRITEASLAYGVRDYGRERNEQIAERRKAAQEKLLDLGYQGTYPDFYKKEAGGKILVVHAMEEHPFTVSELEYKDFAFRIRFMSEDGELLPELE